VLRVLHTADWHLGRKFPSFPEEAALTLQRARLEAVARVFDAARRNVVQAVLCAGDLFDDPAPSADFWEGLAKVLQASPPVPTFLVPGNHDPLTSESVWAPTHPLRRLLPDWVHVVDRDDFEFPLSDGAVLYARPCRHTAGEDDLAMALPARAPGDDRIRVGCVHGTTFDLDGWQTNFPIRQDAGEQRGLDYLAIGDTHSFRDVTPQSRVPTVYPGAPEPTAFDERMPGHVAIVAFRRGRRPLVEAERVAYWSWLDVRCRDLAELRSVLTTPNLDRTVLRLHLDLAVSLTEASEVERIVRDLQGTDAQCGRAGIVLVDRTRFRLLPSASGAFRADLPPVLADTVARLEKRVSEASSDDARDVSLRALRHLYQLLETLDTAEGS
jgi:DNA repair exonuclease SbcCD nuclease subunit